jgi:hypothetical protein
MWREVEVCVQLVSIYVEGWSMTAQNPESLTV